MLVVIPPFVSGLHPSLHHTPMPPLMKQSGQSGVPGYVQGPPSGTEHVPLLAPVEHEVGDVHEKQAPLAQAASAVHAAPGASTGTHLPLAMSFDTRQYDPAAQLQPHVVAGSSLHAVSRPSMHAVLVGTPLTTLSPYEPLQG